MRFFKPTARINVYIGFAKKSAVLFFYFFLRKFFAQLRLLRQNWRRSEILRLKKSLFCALYKGSPAAGWGSQLCQVDSKSELIVLKPPAFA